MEHIGIRNRYKEDNQHGGGHLAFNFQNAHA